MGNKTIRACGARAELGHHGEKCSFDAIVEKYRITDPIMLELAKIVRAADTGRMEMAQEATGLEAIMTGFGIVSDGYHDTIAKAGSVYDALYTNCKLGLILEKNKAEIEKMDRKQRRDFLENKLAE